MEAGELRIVVVYCAGPDLVDESLVTLRPGAVLGDALMASGLSTRHGLLSNLNLNLNLAGGAPADPGAPRFGVWGRVRAADFILRDGDRVEVYRPLQIDPMDARRRRQKVQRADADAPMKADAGAPMKTRRPNAATKA